MNFLNVLVTILIGLLLLSFLVFFHEFGHFVMSHICGVKVESFSIGMGPVLWHHKWGQTDYRISLFPIGGYCGMKGEKDFMKALEENKKTIEGDSDSFYGTSPLKRILIAFNGPFFNLIFAFLCFLLIGLTGYKYYSAGTVIETTTENEQYKDSPSPAYEAGIRSGDKIISMNEKKMEDFTDIISFVSMHPSEKINVTVERNGQTLDFEVTTLLDKESGSGKIGIVSDAESIVEKEKEPLSFFKAVAYGFTETGSMISMSVKSIGILFKGVKITSAVSGPVRITSMLGDTVKTSFKASFRSGLVNTAQFMALISISLFLMNLLPVPVLDGGLILFSLIELITRKKTSPKVLYYIQYVGLAFILVLLVIAAIGDFSYFFKK